MVFFLLIPVFIILLIKRIFIKNKPKSLNCKHVVVTGGSSGIGRCVAILAAKMGAHVTIIARDMKKLQDVQMEIKESCQNDDQKVTILSADVSQADIKEKLLELDSNVSPIYMLVNCAGMAICGKVEDIRESEIHQLINVNYLGTIYPVQALVPKFKQRKDGIIVITASQVALMGMFGYSIYSGCKFALRGFAESINMEVKPFNISVTLALPPDTDTPGYERENETKPKETKLISETGGLIKPEVVAEKLIKDSLDGNFFSYVGFESFILTTLCTGMSPFTSILETFLQIILLGPLRLIGIGYIMYFDNIIKKCHNQK